MEQQAGMEHPIDLDEADEEALSKEAATTRSGFLPIVTNWFDRLFIGIYLFVALELLWMRFLEQSIPLWVCHILAVALGVLIVWKG
jgi:predicted small integral membrane protein